MKLLTEVDAFSQCQSTIDSLIMREKRLPDQVFKKPLSHFAFINSDDIFHAEDFFRGMQSFLAGLGESRWFLAVIDPDPVGYFFRHFGKYPIIEISAGDTADDYQNMLRDDPGNSPADAIASNSTIILLYSDSGRWAIYGDRDYELAVISFAEMHFLELFISVYDRNWVFNVDEAIENILEGVYRHKGVPLDIRNQLINNYSTGEG